MHQEFFRKVCGMAPRGGSRKFRLWRSGPNVNDSHTSSGTPWKNAWRGFRAIRADIGQHERDHWFFPRSLSILLRILMVWHCAEVATRVRKFNSVISVRTFSQNDYFSLNMNKSDPMLTRQRFLKWLIKFHFILCEYSLGLVTKLVSLSPLTFQIGN